MTHKRSLKINPKKAALATPATKKEADQQIKSLLKKNAEAMKALA